MRVKIINGTYGYKPNPKKHVTPVSAGGVVEVSDQEASRLVNLGIAAYVRAVAQEPLKMALGGPFQVGEDEGTGKPTAEAENASGGIKNAESKDTAELQEGETEANDVLDIVDGHFTIESLMRLTRTDMEGLAEDLGVDVSRCRNKSDIAALLSTVEVQPDNDGEAPPELGAEAPLT